MYKTKILIAYCTILISMIAFYNKFPLLTMESGEYINGGFSKQNFSDIYSYFIAHSSWGRSLWPVILTQSALVSLLIYYWFKYFSIDSTRNIIYVFCVFVVSFCMSCSVVASTIDPGIFKGIGILSAGLLFMADDLRGKDYWITVIILLISVLIDSGTGICVISLMFSRSILNLFRRDKFKVSNARQNRLKKIVLAAIGSVILLSYYQREHRNWTKDENWKVRKIEFFTNSGLLTGYVNSMNKHDNNKNGLKITLSGKPEIKSGYSHSDVLLLSAAIDQMRSEKGFNYTLIKAILKNFGKQSLNIPIELYPIPYHNSQSFKSIYHWFNWESREYLITRQLQNWLDLRYLSYMQLIMLGGSCLAGLVMLLTKLKTEIGAVFLFSYLAYFMQSFFTSLADGEIVSLNNQICWLIIIPYLIQFSRSNFLKRVTASLVTRKNPTCHDISEN